MLQQQPPFKEKKIFQDVGPWKRRWHPEKCLPDIFPDKILVLFLGLVSYRLDAAGFAVLGRGLGFCYLRGGLVFPRVRKLALISLFGSWLALFCVAIAAGVVPPLL